MNTSFDWLIVLLSIFIAVYVSYIVVGVCLRISVSPKKTAFYWTIGGAFSMAIGIWAMHFIGMLAFQMPIPVFYDLALTAISTIPALFASAIALFMIRMKRQKLSFLLAGILMGIGISAMHYIGMAAMGMGACVEYSWPIIILSIVIAIVASNIALFMLFHQIDNNKLNHKFKLFSAVIMGVAITGMHYVGMAAATFPSECISDPVFGISLERDVLLVLVTLVTIFILSMTQIMTIIDKNISKGSFFEAVFNAQSSVGKGLLVLENDKITLTNSVIKALFVIGNTSNLTLKSLENSFDGDDFERFIKWLQKSKKRPNRIAKSEFTLGKKQGHRILSTATVGFIHGDRIRFLIITDDITEKKHAERALKQLNESLEQRVDERTNELKQANTRLNDNMIALQEAQSELVQSQKMASLGSLVAGISHEINTPIGIGLTSATSIEEEVNDFIDKYQNASIKKSDLDLFLQHVKDATKIMTHNIWRASELISSFKQVSVDQTNDNYREINLYSYINEIIISMRPTLKKIEISVYNKVDDDIIIYTNPGAIYQILTNFIDNSLKHGFIDLDSGQITIASTKENGELKLVYDDTGEGINESIKNRIFDPFFTTKRGNGGSGLGLNIVYNLVTSTLKGKISVISKENNGARFEILLPKINRDINDVR